MIRLIIPMMICTLLIAGTTQNVSAKKVKDVQKGVLLKSIDLKGANVKYAVYVPPSYNPDVPMPAIVFLHGSGEWGTDGLKQACEGLGYAMFRNGADWPFIVIYPQKQTNKGLWEAEDEMVMATLKKTQKEYKIDASRIYLTGTWSIAAKHPDLFAAIAPVCGWGSEDIAKKLVKMPIWIFHGEIDQAVNVKGALDMEKWIKDAGGICKMTIYPGVDHYCWGKAYGEESLGQWFLSHKQDVSAKKDE
jgi:predicted peptidase